MPLWEPAQIEALERALAAAHAGTPTVLSVEGEAGTGKTSLLDELTSRAVDIPVLVADGVEGSPQPFSVLEQWGTRTPGGSGVEPTTPFLAAQWLRARLHDVAGPNPVILRLDDLHWADPESVESLTWLLRRATGDRLLVAVGSRPLSGNDHAGWQRWLRAARSSIRVPLAGLSRDAATELVRALSPDVPDKTIEQLWMHTSGNPLYLTALLAEHEPAELSQMGGLPAPAQYAASIRTRLDHLPEKSLRLVQTAAVLGTGWVPLPDLAAVAGVACPTEAAQASVDAGLLHVRTVDGALAARIPHALTRAAIYQQTPLPRRGELHDRAAAASHDPGAALEHRMAGADSRDDDLAAELQAYAERLHRERSHRLAAQYLRWSSTLTSDPALGLRRRLLACFDSVQARDLATVTSELARLDSAANPGQAALLRGADAVLAGRWREGARLLATVVTQPEGGDQLARYRAEALLAWARLAAGEPTELIVEGVARAERLGVMDSTVAGYAVLAGGQAMARSVGAEAVAAQLGDLPSAPGDVPPDLTDLLSWRGALRTVMGFLPEAVADLSEVQRRMSSGGLTDAKDSVHGILGVAHWLHGQWDLAQVSFRLVLELSEEFVLPLVLTYQPLHRSGTGDFAEADRFIGAATDALRDMPWQEAVQVLLIARVVRLHAGGTPDERRALLDDFRALFPGTPMFTGLVSSVWLLHAALATIWADELDDAEHLVKRMHALAPQAPWVPAAVAWLTGLVAEARGDMEPALLYLRDATGLDTTTVPLYGAHMLADRARLARALHRLEEAETAAAAAQRQYRVLGAAPYLDSCSAPRGPRPQSRSENLRAYGLSDREHDVASLIAAGLSYAQIARDLFITQSTVNFHVSNIYAKVGVRSRHQLVEVLRHMP